MPQLMIGEWSRHMFQTQGTLRMLSELTGGRAIVNRNDFDDALREVDAETSDYYVLGFYTTNPDPTVRTRRLRVEVPGRTGWTSGRARTTPCRVGRPARPTTTGSDGPVGPVERIGASVGVRRRGIRDFREGASRTGGIRAGRRGARGRPGRARPRRHRRPAVPGARRRLGAGGRRGGPSRAGRAAAAGARGGGDHLRPPPPAMRCGS